jgi:hypothetical protein
VSQQNAAGGWNYTGPSTRNDLSVSGWQIMAVKSAKISGLKVPETVFQKFTKLLDLTTDNNTGTNGASWYAVEYGGDILAAQGRIAGAEARGDGTAMQAVALLCRQFMGARREDPFLQAAAAGQVKDVPKTWPCNLYQVYYGCLGQFQMGGEFWKKWNAPVSNMLMDAQVKGGDDDGSWDFQGVGGYVDRGGRVVVTAMACLCLEVYWRNQSVFD